MEDQEYSLKNKTEPRHPTVLEWNGLIHPNRDIRVLVYDLNVTLVTNLSTNNTNNTMKIRRVRGTD